MDKSKWENEYPKMPEAFHQSMAETVRKNIEEIPENTPQAKAHRKPAKKKILILSLAAVFLFGTLTAIAKEKEEKFNLAKYLEISDHELVGGIFQTNISDKVEKELTFPEYMDMELVRSWKKREDNLPLLDIQQIIYDGAQLCIYATRTENGGDYELESNHLFINGEWVGPIEQGMREREDGYYIYRADTRALGPELKSPFKVTLPLSVYGKWGKRYENQDLSFTVDIDAVVEPIKDQEFIFDNYTVKITDMKKSVTTLWGKVTIERTKEQQAAYEEEDRAICFLLFKSKDGTVWTEQMLTDKEGVESGSERNQWYFSNKIPSGNEKSVMLYLLAREKDKLYEKFGEITEDKYYGEGMEIMLE